MEQEHVSPKEVRRLVARILLAGALASCAVGLMALAFRHVQKTAAGVEGVASSAETPAIASDDSVVDASAADDPAHRTVELAYTSLDIPADGEAHSQVTWDDAWFSADETVYNQELARTAAVLSALAYSESGYYKTDVDQPAYMEQALEKLGFSDISTESYRYRSEVVDEVLNLVTNDSDTVAYTIARRHLVTDDGTKRDLILVSARGSYGSEWLSNLDLSDANSNDHGGYVRAAREIDEEIAAWTAESRRAGAEVSVLMVGHSRGGAVVNLATAGIDNVRADTPSDEISSELSQVDRVYTYTFASPRTTLNAEAHAGRYANIFNIVNPSDIMPFLPLEEWGYQRYGTTLLLPGVGDEGFDERYAAMQDVYEQITSVACAADPTDKHTVEAVIDSLSMEVGSIEQLVTPKGAVATFFAVSAHVDPVRILYSHYPTTYIAWMNTLDGSELTAEQPTIIY